MDDLTDRRFGRWHVIGYVGRLPHGNHGWDCLCDCGTRKAVPGPHLRLGLSASCGCFRRDRMAELGRSTRRQPGDSGLTYSGAHVRVRKTRGPASGYPCSDCEAPAMDWSLRHDAPVVMSELVPGRRSACAYSEDPCDYEPRCRKCHKAYDTLIRSGEPEGNYTVVVDSDR